MGDGPQTPRWGTSVGGTRRPFNVEFFTGARVIWTIPVFLVKVSGTATQEETVAPSSHGPAGRSAGAEEGGLRFWMEHVFQQ